jgi:hypothetical protein
MSLFCHSMGHLFCLYPLYYMQQIVIFFKEGSAFCLDPEQVVQKSPVFPL